MTAPRRYLVKEIFGPTLQGEGAHAGTACVFLRFAVCNLACSWCDTDFRPEGAVRMSREEIVTRLLELDAHGSRLVIVTGGEPALHWDLPLAEAIKAAGFKVHMESNGTRALQAPVDWLTVSPKPQFHDGKETLVVQHASECKVVVDDSVDEAVLAGYEAMGYERYFLQPCMDARYEQHLRKAIEMIAIRPRWRLSLQMHKIIHVP